MSNQNFVVIHTHYTKPKQGNNCFFLRNFIDVSVEEVYDCSDGDNTEATGVVLNSKNNIFHIPGINIKEPGLWVPVISYPGNNIW